VKSNLRPLVTLAVAACALLASGCPKKPLHSAPPGGYGYGSGIDGSQLTPSEVFTGEERPTGEDARRGKRGILPSVFFDFDSAAIRGSERGKFTEVVEFMKSNPGARLLLEGHCDWRGTTEYNMGLGDRRANAVKQYLGSLGVSAARLETLSLGDSGAAEGGTEAQMQEDRRVEIAILE